MPTTMQRDSMHTVLPAVYLTVQGVRDLVREAACQHSSIDAIPLAASARRLIEGAVETIKGAKEVFRPISAELENALTNGSLHLRCLTRNATGHNVRYHIRFAFRNVESAHSLLARQMTTALLGT